MTVFVFCFLSMSKKTEFSMLGNFSFNKHQIVDYLHHGSICDSVRQSSAFPERFEVEHILW